MDPLYFEKVIARKEYQKRVMIPTIVVSIIVFFITINVTTNAQSIFFAMVVLPIITFIVSRQSWISFVQKQATNQHQFKRIIVGEKVKSNALFKTDGLKPIDKIFHNKEREVQGQNKNENDDSINSIKLRSDLMYYEVVLFITSFILIMSIVVLLYRWYKFDTFHIEALGFIAVLSLIFVYYYDKVSYKGVYFGIDDIGINSRVDGMVPWTDLKYIQLKKIRRNETYIVEVIYNTKHHKRIITLSDYDSDDINKVEYLLQRFCKLNNIAFSLI